MIIKEKVSCKKKVTLKHGVILLSQPSIQTLFVKLKLQQEEYKCTICKISGNLARWDRWAVDVECTSWDQMANNQMHENGNSDK